ncbi:NYN domain-containing protein [Flavobacterium muglaense]|uniref:NYN domain-containing protein n=1 Tax=Flavobacterium muglaense TaxID=2764716 RepID=A0A923N298_9FLAO|nr:NYN domain-containing protein [Flavobacterium muglaense]MBC5838171.1 NYN domain-containing protein [Flavobacterium muglaense]MBC5844745.1 NYN domain-containing protein [Flavobacterium muglaense]
MSNNIKELKLAVLIDADNVPYSNVKGMMEEITKYGTPTTKRIYADWTRPNAGGWKGVLLEHAITPIQQYSYTSGKNSSDSALIIDAMDLLYSGKLDGFCIVSSDSDFTRLAIRLRESGMKVIGIGEQKTPKPFISACDRFVFIEVLDGAIKKNAPKRTTNNENKKVIGKTTEKVIEKNTQKPLNKIDEPTIDLIEDSIDDIADDSGWAFLGDVGNLIVKKKPEFDPRNYGFPKLTPMLKSLTDILEIDERDSDKKGIKHVYVRLRFS